MITLLTTPRIRLMGAARLDRMQRVGEGCEWKEREKERGGERGGRGGLKFFLGAKLEEKRFEEVTRERFFERIEMGVSSWVEEEFEASVQVRFLHVLYT